MPRKNVLASFQAITSGSMTGTSTITGTVVNIQYMDNIGVQFVWTGTAVGTFYVDVSADHRQDANGNVTNTGTWIPMSFSTTPVASGTASSIYLDINQVSSPWIRPRYVNASSTGTLNAWVTGKEV
jgi:hypothetical protein